VTRRFALLLAAGLAGCAVRTAGTPAPGPLVVFMSDFGTADDSVAICKGVMLGIEPRLRFVDLTHDVAPFSVRDGARFLAGTAPHFPSGTVFLAVVDPGVGSARKALAARTRGGRLLVVPDNGLLTQLDQVDAVTEVREITNPRWMRGAALSSTFHGRDVFSSAAAVLARGDALAEAGPLLAAWERLHLAAARLTPEGVAGEVIAFDGPYGNLVTDVSSDLFAELGYVLGETVAVTLGDKQFVLPFVRTFSDVPAGEPLLYVDSRGRMGVALNLGDFARTNGVAPGMSVLIARRAR
jgi:S-adenosyl-L-methionine hydrolase (adenosine-forming)